MLTGISELEVLAGISELEVLPGTSELELKAHVTGVVSGLAPGLESAVDEIGLVSAGGSEPLLWGVTVLDSKVGVAVCDGAGGIVTVTVVACIPVLGSEGGMTVWDRAGVLRVTILDRASETMTVTVSVAVLVGVPVLESKVDATL